MENRDIVREQSTRPVRNRRYNRYLYGNYYRRVFGEEKRPIKRLFTPEIKRLLKDWLLRRRDNPYPNREEKKTLAFETGLTYIQICNWFANWRRKLKNAGNEYQRKTWGHLIKTYNVKAHGNIEQFSISSNDSIWGEPEPPSPSKGVLTTAMDHCYSTITTKKTRQAQQHTDVQIAPQCFQISSTTEDNESPENKNKLTCKYKNNIMKKYLKGLESSTDVNHTDSKINEPPLLTKWLESAAKFQPRKKNYVSWKSPNYLDKSNVKEEQKKLNLKVKVKSQQIESNLHEREELDAAEALTKLAGLFRRT